MRQTITRIISAVMAIAILSTPACDFTALASGAPQQSATKGKRGQGKNTKSTKGKTSSRKTAAKKTAAKKGAKETSADVKRKQEATQKEIRLTEQQIRENERSIRSGLNELGKLETDIDASGKKIKETSSQISALASRIGTIQTGIETNEKELERLRTEYLKAVKKMRLARKNNSDLAFIFASKSFHQALRRMRYLRQFSDWKDRQTAAIDGKTLELRQQKEELALAKSKQDAALQSQKREEDALRKQHARQDAIVAELRKNGSALKSHLNKKQAEANQLRNRIAALIAEEERKAAEERAAAARKAEEERLARERAEREEAERARKAEEERLLAEKSAKESDSKEKEASGKKANADKGKKGKADKDAKADKKKKNTPSKENYADARKRRPRAKTEGTTKGIASAASASAAGGNFASMKGSLPKPASGGFKVTSRFGRQSLPDLPDVVYDNPGIDAEVASGASALAVYGGKVSGVYMLPGYNTVVIVNHGSYYTVYGNIATPAVKVGDQVKAGQGLGALAPDDDDSSRSSIHFEVWRNREKLNPLDWIR